jgi:hypothetical protein
VFNKPSILERFSFTGSELESIEPHHENHPSNPSSNPPPSACPAAGTKYRRFAGWPISCEIYSP